MFATHNDSIVSAVDISSSSSQSNSMPSTSPPPLPTSSPLLSHIVSDSDISRSNFTLSNEVTSTNAPIPAHTSNDKTASILSTSTSSTRETQTVSDSSLHDNNDYQSMKRAIDSVNAKIDVYMDYQANEMAAHTIKLNSLRDKLNTLDVLQHDIDRMVGRQNVVEQSLQMIRDAMHGTQSINNKLDRLELFMHQIMVRIDDFLTKQWKWTTSAFSDEIKRRIDPEPLPNHSESQCEMKIEQLVAFVHSFAELNRLENADILNRLGNMQSQLIQFFDIKSANAINHWNHTTNVSNEFYNADEFLPNLLNDTITSNFTLQNATIDSALFDVATQATAIATPLIHQDEQKMSNFSSYSSRKRKRTANMV